MTTLLEAQDTVRDLSTKMLHVVEDASMPTSEKAAKLKAYQPDLEKAQAEVADLKHVDDTLKALRGAGVSNDATEEKKSAAEKAEDTRLKSVGEQFVDQIRPLREQLGGSFAGKRFSSGHAELKATISEGTSGTPGPGYAAIQTPVVLPGIVDIKRLPLTVADLFPQGSTNSPLLRYVVQAGYTNAAAFTAEGALKPEGSQTLAVVDETLHKIAETYHVTDEMMEDFAQLQSFLDAQLLWDIKSAEEIGLLSGNGTAPNLLGLLNRSGLSTTFAKGSATANALGTNSPATDNDMDGIYRMVTQIRVNSFIEPDQIVIDAASWQNVALTKSNQGVYYAGGPFMNAGNPMLWGLPVTVTPRMPAGTAVVGNFAVGGQIFRKGGITVEATNSNVDDFVKNLVTIRAEERLLLAVYRPNAFGVVTGLEHRKESGSLRYEPDAFAPTPQLTEGEGMTSVEVQEVGPPPANVQFEQPQGPFVVGETNVDAVGKSTGFHEANPGNEVVSTDIHDQTPSGQFEQPGPEVVALDGWAAPAVAQVDAEPAVQTKVVSQPAETTAPVSTDGAETK